MEMNDFLANFAEQFDETGADEITPHTQFKELEEWDSMIAMAVIGMTDASYNVKLTGDDIRKMKTVEELFLLIQAKIND